MPGKNRKVPRQELIPVPHDALDQAVPMTDLKTLVHRIEDGIIDAVNDEQPERAWDMFKRLQDFGKVSGVGQAAAMWGMRQSVRLLFVPPREFDSEEAADQAFYEIMFVKTGYTPETVRRYVLAWDFMTKIRPKVSEKTWEGYLNRNIIDLIALGQSVREHGSFQKRTLEKLAKTTDTASLRAELRKTWDQEEESNAMAFRLAPDGTWEVFQGGEAAYVGFLTPANGDDLQSRARARIIRKLGIKETQS